MDDYDVLFLRGIAEHLHAAGVGVWREGSAYLPSERAVVLDGLPQQSSAISLAAYTLDDDPVEESNLTGLQVICREPGDDALAVRAAATAVFRALHGRTAWVLGTGIHVVQIYRRSHVAGRDPNGDRTVIQNFHADLYAPRPS